MAAKKPPMGKKVPVGKGSSTFSSQNKGKEKMCPKCKKPMSKCKC